METLSTYEQQAIDFLTKLNIQFKCEFLKHAKHFDNDKEERDIYKLTLIRGNRSMSVDFGNSLKNSGFKFVTGAKREIKIPTADSERNLLLTNNKALIMLIERTVKFNIIQSDKIVKPQAPNAYDLLTCLTKNDPGTFENFRSEFGYDEDSRSAEKTYKAVLAEYKDVCTMFSDEEIEQLQEIQ